MKVSLCIALFLVSFLLSNAILAAQIHSPTAFGTADNDQVTHTTTGKSGFWSGRENVIEKPMWDGKNQKIGNKRDRKTLEIAGSKLPDCMHACGSCTPCRLVIVSLACAFHTEEAESCPISYRCMCNSKSYPVP